MYNVIDVMFQADKYFIFYHIFFMRGLTQQKFDFDLLGAIETDSFGTESTSLFWSKQWYGIEAVIRYDYG